MATRTMVSLFTRSVVVVAMGFTVAVPPSSSSEIGAHVVEAASLNSLLRGLTPLVSTQDYGMAEMTEHLRGALSLSPEDDFIERTVATDQNGNKHRRYRQTFRGIPVWGHEFAIHQRSTGTIYYANGNAVRSLSEAFPTPDATTPGATLEEALGRAKSLYEPADKFGGPYSDELGELVIYLDKNDQPSLAYHVSFNESRQSISNPNFLLDADSLHVLEGWNGSSAALIGTGPGGNPQTGMYTYGGDRDFLDVTQNGQDCTLENPRVKTILSANPNYSFTCPNNASTTVSGGYSAENDAHYHADVTYRMYEAWFGRPPLLGTAQITTIIIAGYNYGAGYIKNPPSVTVASLGDGSGSFPYSVLDAISHEIGHLFTHENSGLNNANRFTEAAAIDEAFADIAGEAAEYFLHGTNSWTVFEDAKLDPPPPQAAVAVRYMYDPLLDAGVSPSGDSIDHAADFTGQDKHFANGVYNKAAYLLATSPSSAWNTRRVFEVMVDANRYFWTSSSTFDEASCGVMQSAAVRGYPVTDVIDAFNAVGVSCADLYINDSDGDGTPNDQDNCLDIPNYQLDADQDGYGNDCDPDYNQDGHTTIIDFPDFLACYVSTESIPVSPPLQDTDDPTCEESDHNGDGVVGSLDYPTFLNHFLEETTAPGNEPGPSGLACAGITVPCPQP